MKANHTLRSLVAVSLLYAWPMLGGQQKPASERTEATVRGLRSAEPETPATGSLPTQGNQALGPRLVKFSGVLTEFVRNPASSSVEMTFAVYKDEVGGEALWTETQNVEVDKEGRYSVLLGAAQADGVPVELFPAGEPRWLGVEIRGQAPQSRTLLVSVPYALKALDAEKLSGKSLSDFVLSESLDDQVRRVVEGQTIVANQATSTGTAQPGQTKASSTSTAATTVAGPRFPPSTFSGTTSDQIVLVQQNGTGHGLAAFTGATGGAAVSGIAANPSAGVGVYGQSATGFAGVFGNSVLSSGFAAGVFGTTSSPDGAGVHGANNNATGFATGVTGFSASVNGNGVFGNATSGSGTANGVFGQTASPGGSGVLGIQNATTGFNSGVSGQTASGNGTGVIGFNNSAANGNGVAGIANASSGSPNGVYGQINATGGAAVNGQSFGTSGYANGVFGASSSPNGVGVSGVNNSATDGIAVSGVANATSGGSIGVYGQISAPNGAGVIAHSTAPSGFNFGVYADTASNEGTAVSGSATSTSGSPNGVFGSSAGQGGGIGVWGVSFATSGVGVGVRGDLEEPTATGAAGAFLTFSPTSVAGQFVNLSRQGLVLQGLSGPFDATQKEVFRVDASGNLHITGNLTVDGMKSSTAKLQDGREVALYAVESPENWFEDFGSAELKNGVAWVSLDASFAQTINASVNYHVFLTANGDSNGLYVARKTAAGFEIREHGGGTSNVPFDYRIVARRRGFETIRLLQIPERKTFETPPPQVKMATAHPKVEPIKIVQPSPLPPMTRPAAPKPVVPQPPKVNVPQAPKVGVPQAPQPR